jgi:major membrane immunogen (membrane-anchored lipoprotein)
MKRLFIAMALLCVSSAAYAAGTTIKNHSGIDIDHLNISPTGKNTFGDDLLTGAPAASLDNGKTYTIGAIVDGIYDLKIADDDDGKNCVIAHIKIQSGKTVSLTKKEGATCK